MTIGSCFAGVGGFDLAFSRCGATTAWTIEIDGNCNRLLEKRFPEALKVIDIRFAQNLPSVDLVCGGWPCQDLSVAGNRAGLVGQRSGLFYEFIRVIKEVQPAFVLFENVAGLLSSNFGRDLAAVLFQLVQCGYSGCYRILDAQHFGLAQRRRRIFGLFARGDIGTDRCIQVLSLVQGLRWNPAPRREARQEIAGTLGGNSQSGGFRTTDSKDGTGRGTPLVCAFSSKDSGADAGEIAHTLRSMNHDKSRLNGGGQVAVAFTERTRSDGRNLETSDLAYCLTNPGSGGQTHSRQLMHGMMVRRLTATECERLMGFPDGWTEGFSDSVRYRMLGNSVAVPVVEWIARRLMNP